MHDSIKILLKITWAVLLMYWLITSFNAKKAAKQETFIKRFVFYFLPLIIAIFLLGPGEWFGHSLIRENFVPHTNLVGIIGLTLCMIGVVVACWSRYLLGKNWSLSVQQKQDHELIESGPYKIVRHPIYTGLLLLFSGNALIVGDYRGLIAIAIVLISFIIKLKKEEIILQDVFGAEYLAYKNKTKALLPGIF